MMSAAAVGFVDTMRLSLCRRAKDDEATPGTTVDAVRRKLDFKEARKRVALKVCLNSVIFVLFFVKGFFLSRYFKLILINYAERVVILRSIMSTRCRYQVHRVSMVDNCNKLKCIRHLVLSSNSIKVKISSNIFVYVRHFAHSAPSGQGSWIRPCVE